MSVATVDSESIPMLFATDELEEIDLVPIDHPTDKLMLHHARSHSSSVDSLESCDELVNRPTESSSVDSTSSSVIEFFNRPKHSASVDSAPTFSPYVHNQHPRLSRRRGNSNPGLKATHSSHSLDTASIEEEYVVPDDTLLRPKPGTRRRVTFKQDERPESVPRPNITLPSFDELVFHVAKLQPSTAQISERLQTMLPQDGQEFRLPSMELLVAEFLHRSAVYLGYEFGTRPWFPDFQHDQKFSTNDVRRWRRLAHHDWAAEEEESRIRSASVHGKKGIRQSVGGWLQEQKLRQKYKIRGRRHSSPVTKVDVGSSPVPASKDVSLLVEVVNSCMSFGDVAFRPVDIFALCNIEIDGE